MIKRIKPKSEFVRNVLTLMTGTTIAQAIPIVVSPVLTRIYTPDNFGVLALYTALTSIVSVVATLRYELAIVQPKQDEDAVAIVMLSTIITLIITSVLFLVVVLLNEQLQQLLGNAEIGSSLYLVPISVLLTGLYQTFNYWNTRNLQYKNIAYSKVSQGAGAAAGQVGLGMENVTGGLVFGNIFGLVVSLPILLIGVFKNDKVFFKGVTKKNIWKNAKTYKKMPQYSALGAFADTASLQMPILMLTKFYDASMTGMFSLTFRVLNLPMSLISRALSQVLFQKIAYMQHHEPEQIQRVIIKLFFVLLSMMIPFVAFIWVWGEHLFTFVFGEPWREAGNMAAILVIAVAIRFAVSPLSSVLALDQNVKLGVLWQFIYFLTITTTLYIFSSENIKIILIAFVVHEVVLYFLYLAFIIRGSRYINNQ